MADNTLFYGDNLDILRHHIPPDCIDLVYLDPPFQSAQDYNVLFEQKNGTAAPAQIQAFEDTWRWDQAAARSYQEVVERGGDVSRAMQAFRTSLGESDMLAYLSMMAPRLVELRRVLRDTGSIYLHCDPTASHYLKMLMDAVFGPRNFRNEVIWKRTGAHGRAKRWGPIHDTILFYTMSDDYTWNRVYQDYDQGYIDTYYRHEDKRGRYRHVTLDGPGTRSGSSGKPWRGVDPSDAGRHWEVPPDRALPDWFERPDGYSEMSVQERLDVLDEQGLIYWPDRGYKPQYKRYLQVSQGNPVQDIVTDIQPISSNAQERLGYPTQKPEELLGRIIEASSNEGDVALDPFCGCGTTIAAAEKLDRKWVGIDITHLAITLIKHRLHDSYGDDVKFDVVGEPVTVSGAEKLAEEDRFQFEWWALGLVGARPQQESKGPDQGIDGRLYFHDEPDGDTKQILLQVKSGKVGRKHVSQLRGDVDREGAEIGVLITLREPTQPMREEAASAGFYDSPWGKHPKIQILTVEEILDGEEIDYPPLTGSNVTYKQAPKYEQKVAEQLNLED